MKNNDFEKTTLSPVIIPLCGFLCAAALILFFIFSAAYFGAFGAGAGDYRITEEPEFSEPADTSPKTPETQPAITGTPDIRVSVTTSIFSVSRDGFTYNVRLFASGGQPYITSVRCAVYHDAEHLADLVLSDGFTLDNSSGAVRLTGTAEGIDTSANKAVVYVEWKDSSDNVWSVSKLTSVSKKEP